LRQCQRRFPGIPAARAQHAACTYATRAAYAALNGQGILIVDQWPSVLLSLAWAVGAGGAYLLERADRRGVLVE
jgi:hypothetical protein